MGAGLSTATKVSGMYAPYPTALSLTLRLGAIMDVQWQDIRLFCVSAC